MSAELISIKKDKVALQWPAGTGWEIIPDRRPCEVCTSPHVCVFRCIKHNFLYAQISRDLMDLHEMIPYPPMIKLAVKPRSLFEDNRTPIEVDVVGITEKGKRFILNPKPRPGTNI